MSGNVWRGLVLYAMLMLLATFSSGCVRAKPTRAEHVPARESTMIAGGPTLTGTEVAQKVAATETLSDAGPDYTKPTSTPTVPAPQPTATPTLSPMPPTHTAVVPSPTPLPAGDVEYVVRAGDTLLAIAARYGTTTQAILDKNELTNPNTIFVGQKLVIPVGYSPSATPAATTVQHTVVAGETLSQIARLYDTTTEAILADNPSLTDVQSLPVNTVLTITLGVGTASRTHVVRRGETISSIARRYGVSVEALVKANALVNPNRIHVGQKLVIP